MKITGTVLKLGAFSLVLLFFTAAIIVVFGQMRFDRTTGYSAIFSSASGLRSGQFVRASGVEVGKVSKVELMDGGHQVKVDFDVDRSLPLFDGTTANIRYLNLIGDRYLDLKRGDSDKRLPAGGTIPIEHTQPALDLDALIGGFRPVFRALDPDKVNNIAQSIVTIFQGQGGTINDILDQTASLTSTIAERDQAIGEVVTNLNTVLDTTVKHQKQFDETVQNLEVLITGLKNRADPIADSVENISDAAGSLADLLANNRPLLQPTLGHLEGVLQPLVDEKQEVNDYLASLPPTLKIIGRAGGIYGDFFNFYACDISLKLNGLQPGGPVRTVKLDDSTVGQVHAAMRTLTEHNRLRGGLIGVVVVLLVVAVGQTFTGVPMLFAQPTYYAQFSDTAGLSASDHVRIAGVDVGQVKNMTIEGDKVVVSYTLGGTRIGTDSRAAIRTDTILGRRNIEITPRGSEALPPGGILPLGQTTTPYQIYDAFFDVTKAASGWDTEVVKRSLNVLSETIDQTYPHLSAALEGVERFSDTIGKRDEQINQLLANANKIAGVLGNRSEQVNALLVNAQTLLGEINARGQAVSLLLERVSAVSEQVKGFIDDNPNINKVLEQLRVITDLLNERKHDLAESLTLAAGLVTSLGEAVASGPYFKVMLVNLLPYQILQPFVDAAFKNRGIDPEKFWGDAGLPAWRFPDPNAARFENGAPAPGPAVLEGTPEHPGPAVRAGTPCSYTPGVPDGLPRPGNPLPCADLSVGPFGNNPYGPNYGSPDVVTSDPNAHGPGFTPGVPAAAIPGQLPPDMPGVPAPIAPGPPGARTVPVGPLPPQPPDFTPGIAPLPPALTGPPPPPGPGPNAGPAGTPPLPGNPPFLRPGAQE